MNTDNNVLIQEARNSLTGKWGNAIIVFVIFVIITAILQAVPVIGGLISFVISGPLTLGIIGFYIAISRNTDANVENIFSGFNNFKNAFIVQLIVTLCVIGGFILLIVPGFIIALKYSQCFFILHDNPKMEASDVMKESNRIMEGNKMKLFMLGLKFFLYSLLCILTLGIGFLWLYPIAMVTQAKFYDDIKNTPKTNSSTSEDRHDYLNN